MVRKKVTFCLVGVFFLVFFNVGSAVSYDSKITPSISVSLNWSDNIESERNPGKEDVFTVVKPVLRVDVTGKRDALYLVGSVTGEYYTKNEHLNGVANSSDVSVRYDRDFTDRLGASFKTTYVFTPGLGISETVPLESATGSQTEITRRSDHYTLSGESSITFKMSPRLTLFATGMYTTLQYSEDVGVSDSKTQSFSGRVTYSGTERFKEGLSFGYSTTDYDDGIDTDTYTASLFLNYMYSPSVTYILTTGVTRLLEESNKSTTEFSGSIATEITPSEKSFLRVSAWRYFSGGGIFGRTTKTDGFAATYKWISRKVSFLMRGSLRKHRSLDSTEDLLLTYFNVRVEYMLMKTLSVFISGVRSEQDAKTDIGSDITINSVAIGFVLMKTY